MKALIYIELHKEKPLAFSFEAYTNIRAKYKEYSFYEFDNFSDRHIIDYTLIGIQSSTKIIVLISGETEKQLGYIIHFFKKLSSNNKKPEILLETNNNTLKKIINTIYK